MAEAEGGRRSTDECGAYLTHFARIVGSKHGGGNGSDQGGSTSGGGAVDADGSEGIGGGSEGDSSGDVSSGSNALRRGVSWHGGGGVGPSNGGPGSLGAGLVFGGALGALMVHGSPDQHWNRNLVGTPTAAGRLLFYAVSPLARESVVGFCR